MSISQSDFERAEDYVAGRLSAVEQAQFETELATNPELATETAQLKAMRTGLRRLAYRDEIMARHTELMQQGYIQPATEQTGRIIPLGQERTGQNRPGQDRPLWQYIAIAASLLLLLGFGWFFVQNQFLTPSPANIAGRFMQQDLRLDASTRHGEPLLTAPGPGQLSRQEAIASDTLAIRAGFTALTKHNPARAIRFLQPARNCPLPDWQANARYLLALSYLQTGQVDQAKAELNGLRQTTYFGKEADQLLHELAAN